MGLLICGHIAQPYQQDLEQSSGKYTTLDKTKRQTLGFPEKNQVPKDLRCWWVCFAVTRKTVLLSCVWYSKEIVWKLTSVIDHSCKFFINLLQSLLQHLNVDIFTFQRNLAFVMNKKTSTNAPMAKFTGIDFEIRLGKIPEPKPLITSYILFLFCFFLYAQPTYSICEAPSSLCSCSMSDQLPRCPLGLWLNVCASETRSALMSYCLAESPLEGSLLLSWPLTPPCCTKLN